MMSWQFEKLHIRLRRIMNKRGNTAHKYLTMCSDNLADGSFNVISTRFWIIYFFIDFFLLIFDKFCTMKIRDKRLSQTGGKVTVKGLYFQSYGPREPRKLILGYLKGKIERSTIDVVLVRNHCICTALSILILTDSNHLTWIFKTRYSKTIYCFLVSNNFSIYSMFWCIFR